MKTAEEWHHTQKYIAAQRESKRNWVCHCMACENVRAIQADAKASAEAGVAPKSPRGEIFQKVSDALEHAYAKHGSEQWGRHEFYAILKEEIDELWDAIKQDKPLEEVKHEALQAACVITRYLETGDRYWERAA